MSEIQTVRDLYNSMPDNVAFAVLGKNYYKWSPENVPSDEQDRCKNINDVLEDLGYQLKDPSDAGSYNDIQGYMGCQIVEI